MLHRSLLVATCILVGVALSPLAANAYTAGTNISYSLGSQTLSGYSYTWKDPGDGYYWDYCAYWRYDDLYNVWCEIWYLYYEYASVYADVYSPTSGSNTVHSGYADGWVEAESPYSFSVTPTAANAGVWTGRGRHFYEIDAYVVYCPSYDWCIGPFYEGTSLNALGQTQMQTTVPRLISMSISRYIGTSLTDTEADSILASATQLLSANDGVGDVACPVVFQRDGIVSSFSTTDGDIDTPADHAAVTAEAGFVRVVNSINYCGGPPAGPLGGCANPSWGMVVIHPHSLEAVIWAHEYGHTQGLWPNNTHNPAVDFIGYGSADSLMKKVTQTECNSYVD